MAHFVSLKKFLFLTRVSIGKDLNAILLSFLPSNSHDSHTLCLIVVNMCWDGER